MDKKDKTKNRYQKLSSEQKVKYFGEVRNERRRQQYASDTDYRQSVLDKNRESYLRRRKVNDAKQPDEKMLDDAVISLKVRRREFGPVIGMHKVIKRPDLAAALKVSPTTMTRWLKLGMMPEPELYEVIEGGAVNKRVMYYTEKEARAIFDVYKDHISHVFQYSDAHEETREALQEAVTQIRKSWRK